MIDLDIAKYAQNKRGYQNPLLENKNKDFDGNPILKRQAVVKTLQSSRAYRDLLKRIHNSASYARNEKHNKQVAMLVNRERFQQNATWQGEYDRLASTTIAPELQPFVNARLDALKKMLINK